MSEESLLAQPTADGQTEESTSPAPNTEQEAVTASSEDAATTKDEGAETEDAGAPESYETFSIPEGYPVDEGMLGEFHTWAKEQNLTQDKAQTAIDLVVKTKELEAEHAFAQRTEWAKLSRADEEFGGANFDKSMASAVKAREKFADKDLMELLESTSIGNHPAMVRFFVKVGESIAEDKVVIGSANATPKTREQIVYPNMN
tara:strand:- start:55 stop:660 length:606 start_codon:yes stop_codon:yes gene_type:complete